MGSFNKIVIVGYLGRDPEIRYLPDGSAVVNFSVATTEKTKRNGESQDVTTWFKVNVWGKQGEACNQYLSKGSQAYIEGRLSQTEYTDRDGNKRTFLEVKATDVQFLDRQPQGESRQRDELDGAQAYARRQTASRTATEEEDSLIPF